MGWKAWLAALAAGLLVGCATTDTERAPAETVLRLKRVAVVSNVADVIKREYTGMTAFGNERHVLPIGEWKLDRAYESQIADVLRQSGLGVVDAGLDASAFGSKTDAPATLEAVRKACAAHKLDGLFLLTKSGTEGILVKADGRARVQGAQLSTLELLAKLALFECASGQAVAVRDVQMGRRGPGDWGGGNRVPHRFLPDHWPLSGEWKPEILEDVRAELVKQPAQPFEDTVTYILKGTDR